MTLSADVWAVMISGSLLVGIVAIKVIVQFTLHRTNAERAEHLQIRLDKAIFVIGLIYLYSIVAIHHVNPHAN